MRLRRLTAPLLVLLMFGLVATGCGWSPSSAPPPQPDTCSPADGPTADTVSSAMKGLSPAGGAWSEAGRGHTHNCRLYWVQVSDGRGAAAPQHLLFFDRNTPLGTATPEPKPYTTVLNSGEDTVTVQYQVEKPGDAAGRPTGIGQVRFRLGSDGRLQVLDPIPS